ncbi:uncharacterized protein KY384_001706 [Bacidia gigantensis]|uniref:uncharacterized protein n=1 Tax=Bacidia gigantensis TaxID=2732470 RepID=UPI001D03F5C7|nr:uncharacterized protein KY384_001706 [Bacidia gigantensis]KAG8533963.1 hypothetical protein KY384_001706 [Bacidia gigantensis]
MLAVLLLCLHLFALAANTVPAAFLSGTATTPLSPGATDTPNVSLNSSSPLSANVSSNDNLATKLGDIGMLCSKPNPARVLNHRDFYLNSMSIIHQLALKDSGGPGNRPTEPARVISLVGADHVVIRIGGGPEGTQRLRRDHYLKITSEMMDTESRVYGMSEVYCTMRDQVFGSIIARYEVTPRDPTEALPSFDANVEYVTENPFTITTEADGATDGNVLPNPFVISNWADDSEIGPAAFYVPIAAAMFTLSMQPKSMVEAECSLTLAQYPTNGEIRSVRAPYGPTRRAMDVREMIEALFYLVHQAVNRVDTQGKKYVCIVESTSQGKKIGALTIQKRRVGGQVLNAGEVDVS